MDDRQPNDDGIDKTFERIHSTLPSKTLVSLLHYEQLIASKHERKFWEIVPTKL